jgi:hypothetical protein
MSKRCTKIHRVFSLVESVCESARRKSLALVSVDEKEHRVHVDPASRFGFQRIKKDVVHCTNSGVTFAE